MSEEYSTIKKYLPQNATSILDIVCSVAGIDVLINNHYKKKLDIFLVDKTEVDKTVYYNYEKRGSFYNSLQIAKSLLSINGVDINNIHLQEATENNEITFNQKFDIVISLISWGFHYPVSTYLNEVFEKMNNNGILILDIRKKLMVKKKLKKYLAIIKLFFKRKNT